MSVRHSVASDIDGLYAVALLTGNAGADASDLYDDPRLVGEVYVGQYLALEPEFAFTLDIDGPAGYVLAALDTAPFEERCEREWWPALRAAYPLEVPRRSSDAELVHAIHFPERRDPALIAEFPSHLHIDLLPRVQGHGHGPRMLEFQLEALTSAGSRGVHLGVALANERAQKVYRTLGFHDISASGSELIMARTLT